MTVSCTTEENPHSHYSLLGDWVIFPFNSCGYSVGNHFFKCFFLDRCLSSQPWAFAFKSSSVFRCHFMCESQNWTSHLRYSKTNAKVWLLSKETDFCDWIVQSLELLWVAGLIEFSLFSLYTFVLFEMHSCLLSKNWKEGKLAYTLLTCKLRLAWTYTELRRA